MTPLIKNAPGEEARGVECATVSRVQVDDAPAAQAVAAVISGPHANVIPFNGWRTGEKLKSLWRLVGRATRDLHLSRGDIAVLYSIAERINDSNVAWPGIDRLASDTGVHRATVIRSIERLESRGYLLRESGGVGKANRYRLRSSTDATGSTDATEGVAPTRPGGVAPTRPESAPLNLLNESEEHLHGAEVPRRRTGESVSELAGVKHATATEPRITIPLEGGSKFTVTGAEIADWELAYPDKDVLGELHKARAWCIANPAKRKTRAGIHRFLNGWLARTNANDPPGKGRKQSQHTGFSDHDYSKDANEWNSTN